MNRCPSIDELERALVDHQDGKVLREHLAGCTKCQRRARRIEENNGLLRSIQGLDSRQLGAALEDEKLTAVRAAPEIAGFEFIRELHRGGQGVVYLARQTATKRLVAIKMLLSATLATSRQRRRFEREIEIAAGLRHPQIVTVFESGSTDDGWLWFAMEYVEGQPLDVFLKQASLSTKEKLELFAGVCEAVAYAHQRGIIHRDLKPANILVDREGLPRVLDFGLAKESTGVGTDSATQATQAGEFMGTFAYAAPEQFKGNPHQLDTRTDVYALGTILYEAITGHHPFPASGSLPEFVRAADNREIVRPSVYMKGISTELEAIILCALASEPVRRYQSAVALGQDLRRYLVGEPVEARRDSHWYLLRRAAHRHRFAASAIVLILIVATSFAILMGVQARRVGRERDRARAAEQQSNQTAQSLAEALRQSNIERGKMLVRTGNAVLGERMIWREYLTSDVESEKDHAWPPDDEAYWALWELYSAAPCTKTVRVHDEPLNRIALSRDGGMLVAGATNGAVRRWAMPNLTAGQNLEGPGTPITVAAMSPNGRAFAVGDELGGIAVWDSSSLDRAPTRFRASLAAIRVLNFADECRKLVVSCGDGRISGWSLEGTPWELKGVQLEGNRLQDVDIARGIIALVRDNGVVLTDLATGGSTASFAVDENFEQRITSLRWADDGKSLALGRSAGMVEVWNIGPPKLRWKSRLHHAATLCLDFSIDGRHLASGGRDSSVQLSDAKDGRPLRSFEGHPDMVTDVCFSQNGRRLITAGIDGQVKTWEVTDYPARRLLNQYEGTVFQAMLSANGQRVLSCWAGGAEILKLGRPRSDRIRLIGHQGIVSCGVFSRDGQWVATGGYDKTVRLWNAADGSCKSVMSGHEDYLESISFCLDDSRLVTASDDATLRLWDIASGECVSVLRGHTARCPMVAVSPDGRQLASCSGDTTIRLWAAQDGSLLRELKGCPHPIRAVCFTLDGRYLFSGGDESMIRLWDVASGQCIATLEGNDQAVYCLGLSPDGRFLVSGTRGGVVQVWSVAKRKNLATIAREKSGVYSSQFTPDGRYIITGNEEGVLGQIDLLHFDEHLEGNRGAQSLFVSRGAGQHTLVSKSSATENQFGN